MDSQNKSTESSTDEKSENKIDNETTEKTTHAISTAEIVAPGPVDLESAPFVGRWNGLVSTTNWEKGRIIADWRDALEEAEAPVTEYSDEAWARRVGGVTGQHVGRLRRVHQRFGETHEGYQGLFWSHFQASLDWDDAEMWLEGAVQSAWSVTEMRRKRWETVGGPEPKSQDVVVSELDEDFEPAVNDSPQTHSSDLSDIGSRPLPEGPDFGDEDNSSASQTADDYVDLPDDIDTASLVQPFANLAELPDDMTEAFEQFKLSLLRHKAENWEQVGLNDVLGALDALKLLARAPASEEVVS